MKFTRILSLVAALALVASVGVTLGGCSAGQKARDTGVQVLDLADNGVSEDVFRGIDLLEAADTDDSFNDTAARDTASSFFAAVETGDRFTIATQANPVWGMVSGYALQGFDLDIANGDLSEASAVLLRKRLVEFGTLLSQVSEGAEPSDD